MRQAPWTWAMLGPGQLVVVALAALALLARRGWLRRLPRLADLPARSLLARLLGPGSGPRAWQVRVLAAVAATALAALIAMRLVLAVLGQADPS